MSVSAQRRTCSAPIYQTPPQKCPENNVRFIIDSTSVLPIIEIMKGLDCYARTCVTSGTKKSHTKIHDLKGFFVPGGRSDIQLRPFLQYAAAGCSACFGCFSRLALPAAYFIVTL